MLTNRDIMEPENPLGGKFDGFSASGGRTLMAQDLPTQDVEGYDSLNLRSLQTYKAPSEG